MNKKECLHLSNEFERELKAMKQLRSTVEFSIRDAIQTINSHKKSNKDNTYKKNR